MKRSDLPDLFSAVFVVAVHYWLATTTNDPNFQKLFCNLFMMFYVILFVVITIVMIKNNGFNDEDSKNKEHNWKEYRKYMLLMFAILVGLDISMFVRKAQPINIELRNFLVLLQLIVFVVFVSIVIREDESIHYYFAKLVIYLSKYKKRSEEEKKKVRFIRELDDMMNYLDEFDQEWEDYMNELESYDEDETKKQILEFVIYMDRFLNKGTKYTDKMMEEYYELSDKAEEYINPVIINEYSYDNDDHTDMEFITEIDKIVRQFDKFIDKHSEYFNKSYDGLNGFNKLKKKMKKFVDRGEMFVDEMAHDYYFAE